MAQLLYFVADRNAVSDTVLEGFGLRPRLEGAIEQGATSGGPSGGKGVLFARDDSGSPSRVKLGYRPKTQRWIEDPLHPGKVWVGMETGNRPGPNDLVRKAPRFGHKTRLADGNEWVLPVARFMGGGSPFPSSFVFEAGGAIGTRIAPDFEPLASDAQRLFDYLLRIFSDWKADETEGDAEVEAVETDPDAVVSPEEMFGMLCRFLALNYQVSTVEVVLLDLFRFGELIDPVLAVLDFPTVIRDRAAVKKKESLLDGPTGSDGEPEGCPDTNRPERI